MSSAFFDHVRGRSDEVPAGYTVQGLRVYRHLVYLGVSQMIEAHFPAVREQLGEAGWRTLIEAYIRQSTWTSPYYGDLTDDFLAYLARESA